MAKKESPSGYVVSNAVHSEKQSGVATDLSKLSDILVKSPQWKKNVMRGIEEMCSEEPAAEAWAETNALQLKASLLDLIEHHWLDLVDNSNPNVRTDQNVELDGSSAVNDEVASPQAVQLAATVEERDAEIKRLQERIDVLEADNERLTEQHRHEVDARKSELQLLQAAFGQFQQESDQLLNELDQENAHLRLDKSR